MILAQEKEQLFLDAMNALSGTYKQVLSLRYQGLSYAQIAEILDIDIKTVGSRINRGIKLIKNSLK
jgi:RNA polymerase sigma factor (sigma-70 family)